MMLEKHWIEVKSLLEGSLQKTLDLNPVFFKHHAHQYKVIYRKRTYPHNSLGTEIEFAYVRGKNKTNSAEAAKKLRRASIQ